MPFQPVAGSIAKLVTNTNSTNTTQPAINWTLPIDAMAKDVSNFRDGRFLCKTLQNATLTFTAVHDASAPSYLASGGLLVDGQVGIAYCYASANSNQAYVVPYMITSVGPKNEGVEGVVMQDVTAKLHNGTITYPSA